MQQQNMFIGNVSKSPVLNGNVLKLNMMCNEYTGKDDKGERKPDRIVSMQFTAFGKKQS